MYIIDELWTKGTLYPICKELQKWKIDRNNGLMLKWRNSSALAMELYLFCIKLSIFQLTKDTLYLTVTCAL